METDVELDGPGPPRGGAGPSMASLESASTRRVTTNAAINSMFIDSLKFHETLEALALLGERAEALCRVSAALRPSSSPCRAEPSLRRRDDRPVGTRGLQAGDGHAREVRGRRSAASWLRPVDGHVALHPRAPAAVAGWADERRKHGGTKWCGACVWPWSRDAAALRSPELARRPVSRTQRTK